MDGWEITSLLSKGGKWYNQIAENDVILKTNMRNLITA